MSTQITIKTIDGRVIKGINYTIAAADMPTDPAALAAAMPGGLAMGVYHIQTALGWVYIPASQIAEILKIKPGMPT